MIKRMLLPACLVLIMALPVRSQDLSVSIPETLVKLDAGEALLPVAVTAVDGAGVAGYQFSISFDDTILSIDGLSGDSTLSEDLLLVGVSLHPGEFNGVAAGSDTLSGAGTLVNLQATCMRAGSSEVTFTEFSFDQSEIGLTLSSGWVHCVEQVFSVDVALSEVEDVEREASTLVPVQVSSLSEAPVLSYAFEVAADTSILALEGIALQNSLSDGGMATTELYEDGTLSASVTLSDSLRTEGVLLFMDVRCKALGTSPLTMTSFGFDVVAVREQLQATTVTCVSGVGVEEMPEAMQLVRVDGVYPNPFQTAGRIVVTLQQVETVQVRVYDVLGREVDRLWEGALSPGRHEILWPRRALSSGIYFYQIMTPSWTHHGRAVIE